MNEPSRQYEILIDKLVTQLQLLAGSTLVHYQRLGKLVDGFMSGLDSGRYGRGASIQQLADDLMAKGVLLNMKAPTRLLYYTQALFNLYPDERVLTEMAERGYTASHARILMTVPEEDRPAFMLQAVDAEAPHRFKPTRELLALLKPEQALEVTAEEEQDDDPSVPAVASTSALAPVPAGRVIKAKGAKRATPELTPVETPADQVVTPDTPALPTPVPSTEHRAGPTIQTYSLPVIKTLDRLQSMLDKLAEHVPNAVITVTEIGKIGSNKPQVLKTYHDRLTELRQAIFNNIECLRALEQLIDDELRSHASR